MIVDDEDGRGYSVLRGGQFVRHVALTGGEDYVDPKVWREQMEDLAASVWTNRKASPGDVRADIHKIVGVSVPEDLDDALQPLSTEQIQEVLMGLNIELDYVQDHSDLCPECYALPGECEPTCGQYEEPPEQERFRVEVARLFTNQTWDSVWKVVSAEDEKEAREVAEDEVRSEGGELSHVTAVWVGSEE